LATPMMTRSIVGVLTRVAMIYVNLDARDERPQLPPCVFALCVKGLNGLRCRIDAWRKVYSLHARIAKGKPHRRYRVRGQGLDRHHAPSFRRAGDCPRQGADPYDGHTLATVIPEIETQFSANLTRIVADRGHNAARRPQVVPRPGRLQPLVPAA